MPEVNKTHNQAMIDMARQRCLQCREKQCQNLDPEHSFTSAALQCLIGVGPNKPLVIDDGSDEIGLG